VTVTDTPVYAKKWQVSARLTTAGSTAHIAAAETCPDTVPFYYGKARASSHSGHNVLILFSIWEKMKNVNKDRIVPFAEKNAGIPGL
jgi:hypothetical protein